MNFAEVLEKVIQENREEVEKYRNYQERKHKFSAICLSFSNFINRHARHLYEFKKVFPLISFSIPSSYYDSLACELNQNQINNKYFLQRTLKESEIHFSLYVNGVMRKDLCSLSIYTSIDEQEKTFMKALKIFLNEVMELKNSNAASSFEEILTEAIEMNSVERTAVTNQ